MRSMIMFMIMIHSASLSHLNTHFWPWWIQSYLSNIMDHCNYLVPTTNGMVEMPINDGQSQQNIASLWISHLLDKLPLSSVMLAHLVSAQRIKPRHIITEPSMIISNLL